MFSSPFKIKKGQLRKRQMSYFRRKRSVPLFKPSTSMSLRKNINNKISNLLEEA